MPESLRSKDINKVLSKLTGILKVNEREALYWILLSYWMEPSSVVLGAKEPLTQLTDKTKWAKIDDIMHVMMYLDTIMYLPDDILVKVDRAFDGRQPRIARAATGSPHHRVRLEAADRNEGQRHARQSAASRNLLYRYVPKQLVDRPKKGFGVPIHEWLRGPMRSWAEDLLDESRLKNEGYFDAKSRFARSGTNTSAAAAIGRRSFGPC